MSSQNVHGNAQLVRTITWPLRLPLVSQSLKTSHWTISGSNLTQVEPCIVNWLKSRILVAEMQALFCYAPNVGMPYSQTTHVLVTDIPCLKYLWVKDQMVMTFLCFLLLCFVGALLGFVTLHVHNVVNAYNYATLNVGCKTLNRDNPGSF